MRYTWGSLEYCWKPFTGLIDFFFYYRSSTSLGLECSVLNQCSASGLFRSNFSFPFLIIMESIVTSANRMTHAALVHCFCCFSWFAASIYVLPRQWQSSWDEAWSRKRSHEGCIVRLQFPIEARYMWWIQAEWRLWNSSGLLSYLFHKLFFFFFVLW